MATTKKEIARLTETLLNNMNRCPCKADKICPAAEFVEREFIERSIDDAILLDRSLNDITNSQRIVTFCGGKNDGVVELAEKLKSVLLKRLKDIEES